MKHLLATTAAILLAGSTAFAAGSQNKADMSKDMSKSNQAATQQDQGPHAGITAMSKDKVKQALQKAGFQDIKVLDASYLIQAKTDDGNTVYMMINPPPQSMAQSGSDTTGSTGMSKSSDTSKSNSSSK